MKIWLDHTERTRYSFEDQVSALEEIASASSVAISPERRGFAVSTRLYLLPEKRWQRTSSTQYSETNGRYRLINSVCWHGHYRFMSELFARFPHARILSGTADYRGRTDFFNRAESTGDRNIGSMFSPRAFRDCCLCSDADGGDADYTVYDALQFPDNDTCSNLQCSASVSVNVNPPANGINVGGDAVAVGFHA